MRDREVIDPDHFPSVEEEGLSGIEQEALAYWEQFLPTLSAQLKAQGPLALPNAIRRAWHERTYGMWLERARNPAMNALVAEELFRDVLFPPPEQLETADDDT